MTRRLLLVVAVSIFSNMELRAADNESRDALDEVNKKRATRGLPPYKYDKDLTDAAYECAKFRAAHLMFGHTSDDHSFSRIPVVTAGCAAYPDRYGWLSCCIWENHKYAGAAWVRGRDGKRYMHIFLR